MSSGIIITTVVISFVVVVVVIIIGVKFLYLTIALNWWQISILPKIGAKKWIKRQQKKHNKNNDKVGKKNIMKDKGEGWT